MRRTDIATAELKMDAARQRLLKYVQQRAEIDREEYRRLAERVKKREAEFIRAVSGRADEMN
jgi:hypothetical protein